MSLSKDRTIEMADNFQDLAVNDAEDQIVVALDFGTTVRVDTQITYRTLLMSMYLN